MIRAHDDYLRSADRAEDFRGGSHGTSIPSARGYPRLEGREKLMSIDHPDRSRTVGASCRLIRESRWRVHLVNPIESSASAPETSQGGSASGLDPPLLTFAIVVLSISVQDQGAPNTDCNKRHRIVTMANQACVTCVNDSPCAIGRILASMSSQPTRSTMTNRLGFPPPRRAIGSVARAAHGRLQPSLNHSASALRSTSARHFAAPLHVLSGRMICLTSDGLQAC